MHSFDCGNDITIFHHGDCSGDVMITKFVENKDGTRRSIEIQFPAAKLFEFVADHIRMECISELEQASTDDILGVKVRY